MEHAELQKLVEEAAAKGTERALIQMGLNPADPIQLQEDFAFLRKQRQASEQIGRHVKISLITVAVSGLISLLVLGLQQAINKH